MDRVEQGERVLDLVGLQRPDEVERDLRMARLERWKLALGLLHTVFAEHRLTGRDHRFDRLGRDGFRHRDKRHAGGVAPMGATGGLDVVAHRRKGSPGIARRKGQHGLFGSIKRWASPKCACGARESSVRPPDPSNFNDLADGILKALR